jgi:DNA-binding NarL/FixJ family response regulator
MSSRILLADDHPIVRDGLRAVLEAHPDLRVVGEADDGSAVLPLVEQLRPDVLVLDLIMPGTSGLELTRQVRRTAPRTGVVILSMHANEAYVAEALRAGASAYVLKKAASQELVAGIRAALAGECYLSTQISREILAEYQQATQSGVVDLFETLTPRERQVLDLLATGLSSNQIAARLGIGSRTVETHRANLMRKLNLHSTAELVRYAVQRGLLSE